MKCLSIKNPVGRPTKYNPEIMNDLVMKMAKNGFIDKQLAECLGICEATLNVWKNEYPELSESIKRGKELANLEIEQTLYERAKGFEYEETESLVEDIDGQQKKRIKKIKRRALPDPTSMIFWLKNRKKEEWRDRHDHTVVDNTDYEKQRERMDEIAKIIKEKVNEV